MGLINVTPNKGNFGITGAMVVLPFDVPKSILSYRVHSTSLVANVKMPPLARNLVDDNAVAVIDQWIGDGAIDQPGTPTATYEKELRPRQLRLAALPRPGRAGDAAVALPQQQTNHAVTVADSSIPLV